MAAYRYLIVGGGMTAAAAMEGIAETDPQGSIGVITAEPHKPYDRPPLSKALWTGKKTEDQIWRPAPGQATFHLERKAMELDPSAKQLVDDAGEVHHFDKLLLATGGAPRRLPFGGDDVIYFRTLDSYHRLHSLAAERQRFVVLGGGFIGSELAAALAMQGKQVSMVFPGAGIGHAVFPTDLSSALNAYFVEKGVQLVAGERVTDLGGSGTGLTVHTDKGSAIEAEAVVAGLGIRPNTALPESAGLQVEDGIVVNAAMQTSHPDVYAAGDVARFPDALLGTPRRVEHEDAANSQGLVAGRAMAGADARYETTPYFYSDLFELGYEAVGEVDSRLESVADWAEPFRKGVVYFQRGGMVRGVLLWDVWGKVDEARALIGSGKAYSADQLHGMITA